MKHVNEYFNKCDRREFYRLIKTVAAHDPTINIFICLMAVYRHTKHRPRYNGVHMGLHQYFQDAAAGGGIN